MRITDKELLQAIWENQIRLTSIKVLHWYFGGRISVCKNDPVWMGFASSEGRTSRHNVTSQIGKQQLLKRLKDLYNKKLITSSYGDELITFMIDGDTAKNLFEDARNWWVDNGIPERFDENGKAKTVDIDKVEFVSLGKECNEYLRQKYLNADFTS